MVWTTTFCYESFIDGDLLRWGQSYLTNRGQAVVLGGYKSGRDRTSVHFFTVPISNIDKCFTNADHLLYADDKKIFISPTVNVYNLI